MCIKGHSDSLVRKDNHIMYEGEMVEKELEAYGTSIVILVSCHYPHPAGVTRGEIGRPSCCSHGSTQVHSNWSEEREPMESLCKSSCSLPN